MDPRLVSLSIPVFFVLMALEYIVLRKDPDRRYRLHDAMEVLEDGRPVDFADLALRLGFFDQAHFTRAFRKFLGRTPASYGGQA